MSPAIIVALALFSGLGAGCSVLLYLAIRRNRRRTEARLPGAAAAHAVEFGRQIYGTLAQGKTAELTSSRTRAFASPGFKATLRALPPLKAYEHWVDAGKPIVPMGLETRMLSARMGLTEVAS